MQFLANDDAISAIRPHFAMFLNSLGCYRPTFRVTINILAGDDPLALKYWLKLTHPLLKVASFDTFCLVAPQP